MKLVNVFSLLIIPVLLVGLGSNAETKATGSIKPVAISQLLNSPSKYQGKKVRVKGFAHIVFEGTAIYPTADASNEKSGLWLEFPPEMFKAELEKQKESSANPEVEVAGTFDSTDKGHMGMWPATIKVSKLKRLK